jgi:hypothetical protein
VIGVIQPFSFSTTQCDRMRLLHAGRNLGANGRLRKLTYLAGRVAARFLNRCRQDGF